MAFTNPFGDFSDNYQRHGTIPNGGMSIECGCISSAVDATFYVPTYMSRCFAIICDSGDGTDDMNDIPDVSSNYLKCGITATFGATYLNYIAIGY